ncbi:MAG: trk system potassium uptake protein TrkH [Myxococcota bacterium]
MLGCAVAMLGCSLVGFAYEILGYHRELDRGAAIAMAASGLVSAALGAALAWWGVPQDRTLGRREAVAAVTGIWLAVSVVGALPFVIDAGFSPTDGFFEAASGFTTTGATMVSDIEGRLSRPLLLWRSVMQWLGGMGIVVLFVAIFPSLGVSGKHLFRSEVPGVTADGLRPRITETSIALWRLYLGFTVLQAVLLWLVGMTPFEATCHAMTTMSTGGFSTRNASIGGFDSPPIEYITSVFMLVAGVNFGLYFAALRSRRMSVMFRSTEFRVYSAMAVVLTLALSVLVLPIHSDIEATFRHALFMVATTVTSTGFGTDDYMAYPPPGLFLVLVMMFVGGSSGSTAGGIKVSRIVLLAETARAMVRRSVRPSVVQVVRLEGKVVDTPVLLEVATFFFLYMTCLTIGILGLTWGEGSSVGTAFGAMLTSLSNMGPAPFYDGDDNFAGYSATAKVWFGFMMIVGRLEFFTVLALLVPDTWRSR